MHTDVQRTADPETGFPAGDASIGCDLAQDRASDHQTQK